MDTTDPILVEAMREKFAEILAKVTPPAGMSEEVILAASTEAAKHYPEINAEAWAQFPPTQDEPDDIQEQRKYYIIKRALVIRDGILGRDR